MVGFFMKYSARCKTLLLMWQLELPTFITKDVAANITIRPPGTKSFTLLAKLISALGSIGVILRIGVRIGPE